jgi:hypothetical protein
VHQVLRHFLEYLADVGDNRVWRKIQVVLKGPKGQQVRAREGYYAE